MQVVSHLITVFCFVDCYRIVVRSYNCTSIFQLFYVNCISIVYACFHISNVQVTSVNTSLSNGWTTCNCQATIIKDSVANFQGTIWSQINIVGQCICVSMFTRLSIDILFYSQVIACCVGNSFTIANSCNSVVTNDIAFSVSGEGITIFDLISQTGQVDFRNCTGLCSTVTIVVFQCYGLACCIVSVRCSCFTSTVRCCRSNVQIVCFRNTSYVADVSSVIYYIATRFKVSDVLITHVDRAISDVDGVRTEFHFWTICSVGNGIDVY